jgi:LuxR family maltose regulon positive regulatory protein
MPEDSWFWRSVVSSSLGSVYLRAGNVSAAAKAFGEAARIGARGGDLSAALTALRQQAELLTLLGQLRQADETYREALRLAAEAGAQLLPPLAPIYLGMGRLRQTWNDLDGSAQMLAEARTRYAASGDAPLELLLAEARLHQARGDAQAARTLVDRAGEMLAAHSKLRAASAAVWPDGVLVLLAQGDVAAARRWIDAAGVAADEVPDLRRLPEYLALARLLIAEGDAKTAMPLLGAVRQVAAASGCRAPEAEAQVIEALVNADLVEPLTAREREIMQLIATGCSNQDVATQLIMGVSTVKWHLINIYGKLQVRNRTQAVARARTLGLL